MTAYLHQEQHKVEIRYNQLLSGVQRTITDNKYHINLIEQKLKSLDPEILLKRGYSMTLSNGKVITNANQLKDGDVLTTKLSEGEVKSIVKKINK